MVAVLLHDTIDAEMDGLRRETGLNGLAETLGEVSLYGFLVLLVITIATFIPYHLWRWSHRLMGALCAASAFHYAFIMKPFANSDPLGLYVLEFCVTGTLAYVYTLLPFSGHAGRLRYKVTGVESEGDALAVSLAPTGRPMRAKAGQFAFVSFEATGLAEPHPFTISRVDHQKGELRFTIKPMGDYTAHLKARLETGAPA
ncbi:MAG: hypothetical protein AAF638_06940 [Pseudomonadota bacterium]